MASFSRCGFGFSPLNIGPKPIPGKYGSLPIIHFQVLFFLLLVSGRIKSHQQKIVAIPCSDSFLIGLLASPDIMWRRSEVEDFVGDDGRNESAKEQEDQDCTGYFYVNLKQHRTIKHMMQCIQLQSTRHV